MKKTVCLILILVLSIGLSAPATAWGSPGPAQTHQFLTSRSLDILTADKGTAVANFLLVYKTDLLTNSDWPDSYENDFGLYTSHFYNPNTGKTFLGSTTALTRFTTHANNAKKYYATNRTTAMRELGRALHYLADINEPHHAALLIAGISNHTQYESWASANQGSYLATTSTLYGATMYDARANFAGYCKDIFRMAAFNAYDMADEAKSADKTKWAISANDTLVYAQESIAAFLYNFLYSVSAIQK